LPRAFLFNHAGNHHTLPNVLIVQQAMSNKITLFNSRSAVKKYRIPNCILNIAASVDGIASLRYKLNLYYYPYEIKLLQKIWRYRQPETQGF
jgi:hypothetical protein